MTYDSYDGCWSACRCSWWSLGHARLPTLYLILVSSDCNEGIANDYRGNRATEPTEDLVALQLEGPGGFLHQVTVGCSLGY